MPLAVPLDAKPILVSPRPVPPECLRTADTLLGSPRDPIATLARDHGLLLRLVRALENYASSLPERGATGAADLRKFAVALRVLVDQRQRDRREHVLLPWLARHGFDWNSSLFEACRNTHAREQYLIEVLCHAAERESEWSADELRRVAGAASELARVERQLLMRLQWELFPEVLARLEASELERLCGQLLQFDSRQDEGEPSASARRLSRVLIERHARTGRFAVGLSTVDPELGARRLLPASGLERRRGLPSRSVESSIP